MTKRNYLHLRPAMLAETDSMQAQLSRLKTFLNWILKPQSKQASYADELHRLATTWILTRWDSICEDLDIQKPSAITSPSPRCTWSFHMSFSNETRLEGLMDRHLGLCRL